MLRDSMGNIFFYLLVDYNFFYMDEMLRVVEVFIEMGSKVKVVND